MFRSTHLALLASGGRKLPLAASALSSRSFLDEIQETCIFGRYAVSAALRRADDFGPSVLHVLRDKVDDKLVSSLLTAQSAREGKISICENNDEQRLNDKLNPLLQSGHLLGRLSQYHEGVILEYQDGLRRFRKIPHLNPRPNGKPKLFLALDTVGVSTRDAADVITSAASFGLDGIFLSNPRKYLFAPLSWASQGAADTLPIYDTGDFYEFVKSHHDAVAFVGPYATTRKHSAVPLSVFAERGPELSQDGKPWVLLVGTRHSGSELSDHAAAEMRPEQALHPFCTASIKTNPRNDSFYPLTCAVPVLLDAFVSAHNKRAAA
ncbi:hypothetical protein DIPPA_55978 [Diplonema papillatum]|nr:hypothetical protein DIPPA_55978 [Diplonema papillatum]